jgi:hypothetical protein
MKSLMSKKSVYIGAGSGLVIFGLFGLLPNSLLGGAADSKLAGMLFELPLHLGILSRAILFVSMLVGILVAVIVIVTAPPAAAWHLGRMMEAARQVGASELTVMMRNK